MAGAVQRRAGAVAVLGDATVRLVRFGPCGPLRVIRDKMAFVNTQGTGVDGLSFNLFVKIVVVAE